MPARTYSQFVTYVVCLAFLPGCICPTYHGRCHVDGSLFSRTGHDLGPRKNACSVVFPDLVYWEDGLSEEEATAVGLWNNSAYQELLADLQITRADVIQAAQLQNPQATTMFPIGPKQWEFALNVPLDVIWLRPIRVSAAQLESERVAERLTQDGLNVVRDIRVAYTDWQLAEQRAEITRRGAELRAKTARIAQARFEAGAVADLDVSAMRLDALFGKGEAVRATGDAELARERLRYVLGIQFTDVSFEPTPMPEPPPMDFDVEELVDEAVSSRPDLRAIQLAVGAAQQRVDLARRDFWQLGGLLPDINGRGRKGFEAGPGMQINIPIFHQNQGAMARAEADVERLRRQYVDRRNLAALEVRQAYTQLLQARLDLEIWQDEVVPQASAAVTSAEEALDEDGVSLLLVLETTRQLLTSQQRELEAMAQLRRAIAELERSVGRRLLPISPADLTETETLPVPREEAREASP